MIQTLQQAEAVLCAVDRVRKKKGNGWEWDQVTVEPDGIGVALVTVARHVDPRSMVRWFNSATATVEKIEEAGGEWWRVYFTLQEIRG